MADDEKPDYGALYYVLGCLAVVGLVFGLMAFRDWRAFKYGDGELAGVSVLEPTLLVATERVISGYDEGDAIYVSRLSTYNLATGALSKRTRSAIRDCTKAAGARLWCREADEIVLIDAATHAPIVRSKEFATRYEQLRMGFNQPRSSFDVGSDGSLAVINNAGAHVFVKGDGSSAERGERKPATRLRTTSSYITRVGDPSLSFCSVPSSEARVPCAGEERFSLPPGVEGLLHPKWIDAPDQRLVLFGNHLDDAKAAMTLLSYNGSHLAWQLEVGPYADVRGVTFTSDAIVISFGSPNNTTHVIDLSKGLATRVIKH